MAPKTLTNWLRPMSTRSRRGLVTLVLVLLAAVGLVGLGAWGGYRWAAQRSNTAAAAKAKRIGYTPIAAGAPGDGAATSGYDYVAWSKQSAARSLRTLAELDQAALQQWQRTQRAAFRSRFTFPYDGQPAFTKVAEGRNHETRVETWHVGLDGKQLFRFFRLAPPGATLGTVIVFMGHGKVEQLLTQPSSYQRAAGAALATAGYDVYVMENVGMGPADARDSHLHLDSVLSLNGYGWYSLLFAHQDMLIEYVLARRDKGKPLGVAGVSTGGLLALTAAALHPEVDAASVHGIFASSADSFGRDFVKHCECGSIDGLLPDFDLPTLALLVAPRPLHVNNNRDDSFTPRDARAALAAIEPIRARLGGPVPVFTSPPGKHAFALDEALGFFANAWGTAR